MRICDKTHIFGFMSQHLCVSGSSARSMSLDSCLSIHVHLRILCKIHVAGFIAQQPYVSQDPLQDPRLRIYVSASLYLTDALQDARQRLRIHVSASLYLRILCKIHVSGSMSPIQVSASICISGTSARSMSPDPYISIHIHLRILCKIPCLRFMSQHLYTSGSSARSMASDSCLSIHMYLRNLCKIHVSGSVYKHSYVSQAPLQDPCLRIRISASICISGSSARSMSPDPYISPCLRIHVSASSNLRILCKIHVSDSCLSIHVSASLYLRVLCKIHVSGSMSQHPYISQEPLQDHVSGCLNIHIYLRSFCKIHVSDACRIASLSSDFVALRRRNTNFDRLRRVLRGPAQGKQSGRDPRERFAQTKHKF